MMDVPYETELWKFCQGFWNILSLFLQIGWFYSLTLQSRHCIMRKLLQGAITAAKGLLNPRFDGLRIRQEDSKKG